MKIQKLRNIESPFAGITFANYNFNHSKMSQLIDTELGSRVKTIAVGYSDILENKAPRRKLTGDLDRLSIFHFAAAAGNLPKEVKKS